jgi:hypothetical protein
MREISVCPGLSGLSSEIRECPSVAVFFLQRTRGNAEGCTSENQKKDRPERSVPSFLKNCQTAKNLRRESDAPVSAPLPNRQTLNLATLRGGVRHHRRDLREDRADARSNTRHDRTGSHGHKTRHQSVLDEVLAARVLPNSQLPNQILHVSYFSSPFGARQVPAAVSKLSSADFRKNQC